MSTLSDLLATVSSANDTANNSENYASYRLSSSTLQTAMEDNNAVVQAIVALLTEMVEEVETLQTQTPYP